MTSVGVPVIIFTLFENEIKAIINKTISICAQCSGTSIDKLEFAVERNFNTRLHIIPINEEELRITKIRKQKQIDENMKCKAHIKRDGVMKQCSLAINIKTNEMYCTRHFKKFGTDCNYNDATHIKIKRPAQKIHKMY
jgi:hypothetical protein